MNCDYKADETNEINVTNLDLTFIIFIRIIKPLIIFIN